ncbi:LacI family DNA-binding transcriptional regulator [Salisediminibacterium beveridgei]|uniref:Sucrose operon repressor ScrR, LacI family n=1 Tax=Salisediminibacterium beveridgei TaxID=632773 RepID=A0A1D7QUP4_9BACI|nr:LacI family DNA-binding transcriptional regulator [Salisediminibacterium beveridgei]AOM82705.1 Sucrose operon repressor ScrR, LacI family [Salisediminibacterium beveridgei]
MVTIKDIAREAGVSVTSVSRVLNDRGYLSDDLKNSVYEAMEKLNYLPNEMARSLQRKKTSVIGLIIPDVAHPFFSQWTKVIEQEAFKRGYKILLCNSDHDAVKEQEYVDMLQASRVDGLIFASHTQDIRHFEMLAQPVLAFERDLGPQIPRITSDHHSGGKMAIEHLYGKGCRSILIAGGHSDLKIAGEDRYSGAIHALEDLGVHYEWIHGDYNTLKLEVLREKIIHHLQAAERQFDGIFAGSDVIAGMAVQIAKEKGLLVPDDIKITGYDGAELSIYMPCTITTILQPIDEMARTSVTLLIDQIENPDKRSKSPEPFKVKLRQGMTT